MLIYLIKTIKPIKSIRLVLLTPIILPMIAGILLVPNLNDKIIKTLKEKVLLNYFNKL